MTAPADRIFTNAEVHSLADPDGGADDSGSDGGVSAADGETPDPTAEAVAVRDGEIVRVADAYEVEFLEGAETDVVDLGGRVLLPGFIDAHTHLQHLGRSLVHADLADADSPGDCVELLAESADSDGESAAGDADGGAAAGGDSEWILGFGFDESTWAESRYLTREDLDRVSESRPVAAFREDMHVAAVNSAALDRFAGEMPDADVQAEGGDPTGVIVEEAVDVIYEEIEPDAEQMRTLLEAAQREAHRKGVTGVHEMVRQSRAPAVYRQMELDGELALRVRLNYWSDHLDALVETGLRTDHGSEFVRTGGIKTYTDGSLGGRTAKLSEPYADAETADGAGESDGVATGQWVVPPEELRELVAAADAEGFQMTAHAIGDAAVDEVLAAYEETADPAGARHRVEHAEMTDDGAVRTFAESGVVASVQPNFLKWAGEDGLYQDRLGTERRERSNRYADLLAAGANLAFGSDCMPLDPLFGIHQTVNAPAERQRLSVTEALRAYTRGAAYAGFDEGRLGTVEAGKKADLVALERSPWARPGEIADIDVALTVVDGEVVYDGRE